MAICQIRIVFDTSHLVDRATCSEVVEVLHVHNCHYEVDELSAGYEGPVSVDEQAFDQNLFAGKLPAGEQSDFDFDVIKKGH